MNDTFMKDPKEMTDEELQSWVDNFKAQPPTMDYMSEWEWAGRVRREATARGIGKPKGPTKEQRRRMALRELNEHSYAHKRKDPDNCQACAHQAGGDTGPNVAGWLRVWVAAGQPVPAAWFAAEMAYAAEENRSYFLAILKDIQDFGITICDLS